MPRLQRKSRTQLLRHSVFGYGQAREKMQRQLQDLFGLPIIKIKYILTAVGQCALRRFFCAQKNF